MTMLAVDEQTAMLKKLLSMLDDSGEFELPPSIYKAQSRELKCGLRTALTGSQPLAIFSSLGCISFAVAQCRTDARKW
jgi:hypothetical protein